MSLAEILSTFESQGVTFEAVKSQMANLIQVGMTQGLSTNAMLTLFRSAGYGIRTQTFYELSSAAQLATAAAPNVAALALDQLPGEDSIVTWAGGQAGTYLYRTGVWMRYPASTGRGIEYLPVNILSKDLITPGEAISRATDILQAGEIMNPDYVAEIMGAEVRGIYQQTGLAA